MIIIVMILYLLLTPCSGLDHGPQGYLGGGPQNLCYLIWQKGMCRCHEVEAFAMKRLFWIIQVGPKYNHKGPSERVARRSSKGTAA